MSTKCEEEAALGCSTSIMAAKIIAGGVKGIEGLPQDDLREILILVARQPGGAFNIARAFAVCKSFGDFAEDKDLLQAVSFKDFFRYLPKYYELFFNANGLVARCARAGNIQARVILAKAVMVGASNLCCARMEATDCDSLTWRNYSPLALCRVDSASQFLDHFTARGTDPTELVDLVRYFLSRSTFQELVEMQHHLNNFVALYLDRGKTFQHQKFINLLNEVCLCKSLVARMVILNPYSLFVEHFNSICWTQYNAMQGMGVEEAFIHPLIADLVPVNSPEDIDFEALFVRSGVLSPIFKRGMRVALQLGNREQLQTCQNNEMMSTIIGKQLSMILNQVDFLEMARRLLLASFDALFSK